MAKVSEKMQKGIKDTMAVVIAECTGADVKGVREWLDTVKTAEDFFGKNNSAGMKEYQSFISAKENEYNQALRRSKLRV